ncbi:hypothetical protein DL96DRAFT_1621662 [Flagelloscypha sp. PMI_526]|nr:hypothetical protein DL96DRAFT_1621662 [Flagelloscypha sp. PMI_526]
MTREPYTGTTRKLILGIDVGTTYSGISYSILDPGQVPEIKHVTRFPAQDRAGADSKIPSVIYYDRNGVARAFGAETMTEGIESQAVDEGWTKSEWFKLLLTKSPAAHKQVPPLPAGKTPISVFSDFLGYLYRCAEDYITQTHHNGAALWQGVRHGDVHFVLTHPNAWEGAQQAQLRDAAVQAGLVPNTPLGQRRLQFVTEGEASLHFCLQQGIGEVDPRGKQGILIIDAGGGTIDLSAYSPIVCDGRAGFQEIVAPHCQLNGAVFVTFNARRHLDAKLKNSKFHDDLDDIVKKFDTSAKNTFRDPKDLSFVRFGRIKDNEPATGIKNGQLRLAGEEVASFFEPSVRSIVSAVNSVDFHGGHSISRAFIVGGFAASDYLYYKLKEQFDPMGIHLFRPDAHINKAVSDGAVGYHLDRQVSVRVARYTCGLGIGPRYDPDIPGHREREGQTFVGYDGTTRVHGGFSVILRKNTKVSEDREFRRQYVRLLKDRNDSLSTEILRYVGQAEDVNWMDTEPDNFIELCTITLDEDVISRIARPQMRQSKMFFSVEYEILLRFGLTELQAQIVWKENGIVKSTPAIVVYPDDTPSIVYSSFDQDVLPTPGKGNAVVPPDVKEIESRTPSLEDQKESLGGNDDLDAPWDAEGQSDLLGSGDVEIPADHFEAGHIEAEGIGEEEQYGEHEFPPEGGDEDGDGVLADFEGLDPLGDGAELLEAEREAGKEGRSGGEDSEWENV